MKFTFLSLLLLVAEIASAQNVVEKTWGLIIGPQVTSHRFPHGTGESSSASTTSESPTTQFAAQLYFSRQVKKALGIETNISFGRYGATTHFHYFDTWKIYPRIETIERRVSFVGLSPKFFYRLNVGSFSISPFAGLSANLVVSSTWNNISVDEAGNHYTNWSNVKGNEAAVFIGYDVGLKMSYPISKKVNLEVRPFYNHFLKGNYVPRVQNGKVFSGYGVMIGFSMKR
jgi:hypothetical protein